MTNICDYLKEINILANFDNQNSSDNLLDNALNFMVEDETDNPEDFFSFYHANTKNLPSNYNNIHVSPDFALTDDGEKNLPVIKN